MSPQPQIRVLIADDHRIFAEALGLALDADPRLNVVAAVLEVATPPASSDSPRVGLPQHLLQFRASLAH